MFIKKECVAMLLAGGQGSRLYALTEKVAKPAVQFGGKYRIIDLTLSNCINSGIDTVGVLTQYQPLVLNEYIGNGQPWDLDRQSGGVMVLPPYQGKDSADWYKGTANAIYQNLTFINRYDPDYVLVLSGDHIYKMDYSRMLDYHKANNADCTIAVLNVPIEEASRFGIMYADENDKIYEFEEKPKVPKGTLASMGIYIFNKKMLEKYLIEDEANPNSSNDFGKNIIPNMLNDGANMYVYHFDGYWKDVGTLNSLWEANMELLGETPVFNIYERNWRIFSRSQAKLPQYIGLNSKIENSLITEGCEIHGTVINSVLSSGVYVAPGAVVKDSVIMSNTRIMDGSHVNYSIVDSDTVIGMGAMVGEEYTPDTAITVVGAELDISANTVIPAGAMVNGAYLTEKGE
ncbi:MAG: glucose-1-phosphate adenylyltransferase [Ruminococcaceae bacterium]|nr:glucose-1-phosphate adenylyltransferase [Oscillospiraceae bacterium]